MKKLKIITQFLSVLVFGWLFGIQSSIEFMKYQCNENEFIQLFDSGYYCGKRSSNVGGYVFRIDR